MLFHARNWRVAVSRSPKRVASGASHTNAFLKWRELEPRLSSVAEQLARARDPRVYRSGVGDAITLLRQRVQSGQVRVEELWPLPADQTHPGDKGYALYAEAAWNGFREAVAQKQTCRVPVVRLHAPIYL